MNTKSKTKYILLLVALCSLQPFGMDVFVPVIPEMMEQLGCTEHAVQFVAICFMLACGVGQAVAGLICDKIGRRKMGILSTVVYAMSAIGTAYSTDIAVVSFFRFFCGLGACGAIVAAYAVVNDVFSGKEAYSVFSLIGCSLAIITMISPALGVALVAVFGGWQACFTFLFFCGALTLVGVWGFLEETRPEGTRVPTLKSLTRDCQSVLVNRTFCLFTFFGALCMTQLYLYFSVGSMLFIHVIGLTPFAFALIFGFNALLYMLGNYFSRRIQKDCSAIQVCQIGAIFLSTGSLMMALGHALMGPSVAAIIAANSVMTVGVGLMMGPATGAALEPFKQLAGTASGLFGTFQYSVPALVGFLVTRFSVESSLSIALPLLALGLCAISLTRASISTQREQEISH